MEQIYAVTQAIATAATFIAGIRVLPSLIKDFIKWN